MKKPVLLVSAAAVAAALIGPKLIAENVASELDQMVAGINENPVYSAKVSNVDSGWFETHANIEISLDLSSMQHELQNEAHTLPDEFTTVVSFHAQHGPIILNDGLNLALTTWAIKYQGEELPEEMTWDKEQAFYTLNGTTGLTGKTTLVDSIPEFTITPEDNNKITFERYQGAGELTSDGLLYGGKIETIALAMQDGTVTVNDLTIDMNLNGTWEQMMSGYLYNSDSRIRIASIKAEGEESAPTFAFDDINVSVITAVNDDSKLADFVVTYGLGSFTADEQTGEDLTLTLEMRNLSADFIKSYQDFAQELPKYNEQEAMEKTSAFFHDNLIVLLSAAPEFNITKFSGKLTQGGFSGTAGSKLIGIDALPDNLEDPTFWLQHLIANAELEVDKTLLEFVGHRYMVSQIKANPQAAGMSEEQIEQIAANQLPMMLGNLQQQGLIATDEAKYKTELSLENGQATINGKPMPLPMGGH